VSDCTWNEFRVVFTRSWNDELRRAQGERNFKPNWGVEADAKGNATVNVQTAVKGWRQYAMIELLQAGAVLASRDKDLSIGPFVVDETRLEMRAIGGGISLILEGRIVLQAKTVSEAEELMSKFKEKAKVPGTITVLSDLEALAAEVAVGEEEKDG
jgi:hypothetical protein